jgi:pre-mRNA-splicing factor 18
MLDRPDNVRRSTQGKIAAATQQTSADYLKPLFKSLRKRVESFLHATSLLVL